MSDREINDLINMLDLNFESINLKKNYDEVFEIALNLERIVKDKLGNEHLDYVSTTLKLAKAFAHFKRYNEAEFFYVKSKEAQFYICGGNSLRYAVILDELAGIYTIKAHYKDAELLYLEAEAVLNYCGEDIDRAIIQNNIAGLYTLMGKYNESMDRYFLAKKFFCKKSLTIDHPVYGICLESLAVLHQKRGNYKESEPLYLQVVEWRRQQDDSHSDYAGSLGNLASLYVKMGRLHEAGQLYIKAEEVWNNNENKSHTGYELFLNNLADYYKAVGRYEEAEELFLRSKEIRYELYGKEHPSYAIILNNLADLYFHLGMYKKSEDYYLEARAIYEKIEKSIIDYTYVQNNIANLYLAMCRYDEAEELLLEVKENRFKLLDKGNPIYATCLISLGRLYHDLLLYEKAESLLLQAKGILFGKNKLAYAACLNNLAALYETMEQYDQAMELHGQAFAIRKDFQYNIDFIYSLNNIAGLYMCKKMYDQAEEIYLLAGVLLLKKLNDKHPDYAVHLNNIAFLYAMKGRYAEAEASYRRSIDIFREVQGHPGFSDTLINMSDLMASNRRYGQALQYLLECIRINSQNLIKLALGMPESHIYYYTYNSRRAIAKLISLCLEHIDKEESVKTLFDVIINNKALIYEVTAIRHQIMLNRNSSLQNGILQDYQSVSVRLTRQILEGVGRDYDFSNTNWLEDELDRLERETARQLPQIDLQKRLINIRSETIVGAMPANSYLLEYYRHHSYHYSDDVKDSGWKIPKYIVFVLTKEDPGSIRMIELSDASVIDEEITNFHKAIKEESAAEQKALKNSFAKEAKDVYREKVRNTQNICRNLYNLLFLPVIKQMGDMNKNNNNHLIVAPDGEICRVPFEAFISTEGNFLIEEYLISYLTVGREIVNFTAEPAKNSDALIVYAPDYDFGVKNNEMEEKEYDGDRMRRFRQCDLLKLPRNAKKLRHLKNGMEEGSAVKSILSEGGVKVRGLSGKNAVKRNVKLAMKRPLLLHIISHGFYHADDYNNQITLEGMVGNEGLIKKLGHFKNPLLRSGIALAGINRILSGEKAPDEVEDGVLFGLDVLTTDLLGTELVVLSACDTGLGDIRRGEGVLGLRKAFVSAGVRTVISALWEIDDQITSMLITYFYKNLLSGENKASSLRWAQLRIISDMQVDKYVNPYYWAAFTCMGDNRPLLTST